MRGSGTAMILVIQSLIVIRKVRKTKTKSKKFKVKKYKISFLLSGCHLIGSSDEEEICGEENTLNVPIKMIYSNLERV